MRTKKRTKSRNLVGQTVPGAILGVKVPKEYQAKFDSAKPRMQEFLANMTCYKANKNDKFMEAGTRLPALRRDDSHSKRASGTCSDSVDILSIENVSPKMHLVLVLHLSRQMAKKLQNLMILYLRSTLAASGWLGGNSYEISTLCLQEVAQKGTRLKTLFLNFHSHLF